MSKYKYPTNCQFDMEVKGKDYHISIDMFDDQDEYDDHYRYMVEIFPQDQSKESFESAEFWGTYILEYGVDMRTYPTEWENKDKQEMRNLVKLEVNNNIKEVCEKCNEEINEELVYETVDGEILCEDCFIQYLAEAKGLVQD